MSKITLAIRAIPWILASPFRYWGIKGKLTIVMQVTLWVFLCPALKVFTRVKIVGAENIKKHTSGAIFTPNHISEFDPFLVATAVGPFSSHFPMHYVSRTTEFYEKTGIARYLYGGFLFEILGAYAAIVGIRDFERMLARHIAILCRGQSVCIFPEGKRSATGRIEKGKPGAAYLLWRTGKPIIPVAIHGHFGMTPFEFFARKCTIHVTYGTAITREEIFGADASLSKPTTEELVLATKIIMSRIQDILPALDDGVTETPREAAA